MKKAMCAVLFCTIGFALSAANLPGTLSEDGKILWIDGANLPLEGRAFADAEKPYQRIPDRIKAVTNINRGVWIQGQCSAGMLFRFNIKKSNRLKVRWSVHYDGLAGSNMGPIIKSGADVYGWDSGRREWSFLNSARPKAREGSEQELWVPASGDVMIYLPCYNITTKFEIGVAPTAEITPVKHCGIGKPIVFYGTSITQGGCVSRPGLAYPAYVSRRFDAPHINLGFSGNGRMEMEMIDLLLEIDASAYVLDCLWNMKQAQIEERFEPFVRKLKAARPDAPIVTLEMCVVGNKPNKASLFIRGVVEKLKKEDPVKWANLRHIQAERLFFDDSEGTVDRCHPNDWGMMKMSIEMVKEFEALIKDGALKK